MKIIYTLSIIVLFQSFSLLASAQSSTANPMITLICALSSGGTTVSFRADINAGIQKVESKSVQNVSALIVNYDYVPNKIGLYIKGPVAAVVGEEFDLSKGQQLQTQSKNADGSVNFLSCQLSCQLSK